MKKLLLIIVSCFICLSSVSALECKNKVNINIFHGDGCPHCESALEYFEELEDKYGDCIKITKYEVWNDQDNLLLMKEVSNYLDDDASGVPYIIIGDESFVGYSEEYNSDIEEEIDDYLNSYDYDDIVSEIKNGNIIVGIDDDEDDDDDEEYNIDVDDSKVTVYFDDDNTILDFIKNNISYFALGIAVIALLISIINSIKLSKNNQ